MFKGTPTLGSLDGDVSWLAAPFVESLPKDWLVLDQVRSPLAVIRSYVGIDYFSDMRGFTERYGEEIREPSPWRWLAKLQLPSRLDRVYSPLSFRSFLETHAPDSFRTASPVEGALKHWIELRTRWSRPPGLPTLAPGRAGSPGTTCGSTPTTRRWSS